MRSIRLILSVILLTLVTTLNIAKAESGRAPKAAPKVAKSVSAKLYWAAKLMDSHNNWSEVSELLRELLDQDLDSDYCRSRLKAVKQYVDSEPRRRKSNDLLDTHSFLEARLLLVECIQEFRPRLNHMWTGEVRALQAMLKSAIFPGREQDGVIVFPDPSTYSFDLYGYTVRNIKALMTHPGGEEFEAIFKQFIAEPKKEPKKSAEAKKADADANDDDLGNYMFIRKLDDTKDRVYSYLWREGYDIETGEWSPARGSKKTDDIDFGKNPLNNDTIKSLTDVYVYLKELVQTLRNKRSLDEYEPLTLLWIAVSNPGLIEHDPQLKAFVSGIKLKYKLAQEGDKNGVDTVKFEAHDYKLVGLVNDALVPDAKVKLAFEVDNETGRQVLYLVSNFNGDTNLYNNLFAFKNVVRVVQGAKYMPEGMAGWIKALPANLPKFPTNLGSWFERLSKSHNMIYKAVGTVGQPAVELTIGRKVVTSSLETTGKVIENVAKRPLMQKAFAAAKSDWFLRSIVAVSIGADLTTGIIRAVYATDSDDLPEIYIHTGSQMMGTAMYLIPSKRLIRGIFALDMAHLVFDSVPSTADIIESVAMKGYSKFVEWGTKHTPEELRLLKIKKQLEIADGDADSVKMLSEFEAAIDSAKTLDELSLASDKFSDQLGEYTARRLVFHYVTVTALNSRGNAKAGALIRDQYNQYDRMMNSTWFTAPGSEKPRQLGLKFLTKEFNDKWLQLGGQLPRRPKAFVEAQ